MRVGAGSRRWVSTGQTDLELDIGGTAGGPDDPLFVLMAHGAEANGVVYCGAHCARSAGVEGVNVRV